MLKGFLPMRIQSLNHFQIPSPIRGIVLAAHSPSWVKRKDSKINPPLLTGDSVDVDLDQFFSIVPELWSAATTAAPTHLPSLRFRYRSL